MNTELTRVILLIMASLLLTSQIASAGGKVAKPPLGFRSAQDHDEGREVLQYTETLLQKAGIRNFTPYISSGDKAHHIFIYGVNDPKVWDKIEKMLSEQRKRGKWRTIYVEFLEREVWIKEPNGDGRRGSENVLRALLIK